MLSLRIDKNFGIYECGSDFLLLKRLNALIIKPDPPNTIGIVLDVDTSDITRRWQQIQQKIKTHGYKFPKHPLTNGTILQKKEGYPLIGIWLMPNNKKKGMLEDFLIDMVDKEALQSAEECILKAKEKGFTKFKSGHYSKALLHTWLSWQNEPGKPLGQAITADILQPGTELAKTFINWLKKLFQ